MSASAAVPALPDVVVDAWCLDPAAVEQLSGGRTNITLRACGAESADLVVQRLAAGSHDDLLGVMENLLRVTSHLEWQRAMHDGPGAVAWYPAIRPTQANRPYVMTDEGDVWRAFAFRPGRIARGHQSRSTIASIAAMYGRFAASTVDLGGPELIETTAGFHHLGSVHERFSRLADAAGDAEIDAERSEIERLMAAVEQRSAADGLAESPARVVHNDTKLSNMLLASGENRAVAVLDLDLVMMGPAWHDVGDLVRSAAWHDSAEPGPTMSPELFATVLEAWTAAAVPTVSRAELATFAVAGPRLSLELGLRYLCDHLSGEPRLRVDAPGGHLRRGLANVVLADEMLKAYDALRKIADAVPLSPREDTR